ncbi:MAG: TlpA family protein disulfide reductase [Algicola sp.]|nr:TlpA family protein disulfide reductase [Algicola sp.]
MKKYLLILALLPSLLIAQKQISGTFTPAEEFTYAFLYHATPTGAEYVDRAELDDNGHFSIPLDSTMNPGIYKIIYALPPEDNNFDFIYNGKEAVAFDFSLENGLEFTESQENKLWASYIKSMEMVNRTLSNFYTQESTDKKAYLDIIKTLNDTQKAYEESSQDLLANAFIKGNKPYIPVDFEDLSTYSKNLKSHYLEHVDFSNTLLQSSDFLVERVMAYIFGMNTNSNNEVYKKDVDELMTQIGEGQIQLKTILFEMVWRRFTAMDNPEMANYVADNYLLELAQQTNYTDLTTQLMAYKNVTIGSKAINFDISYKENGQLVTTSLHDLDIAKQYVLVFWSSTCIHCLDELPKLKDFLSDKADIKVIAFGLEDDDSNWRQKIKEFPDFIHVLGLEKWNNATADAYGIGSTPTYFLLDKDKKITAKPNDFDDLKTLLE